MPVRCMIFKTRIQPRQPIKWFIIDSDGNFHGWYVSWEQAFMAAEQLKNPNREVVIPDAR